MVPRKRTQGHTKSERTNLHKVSWSVVDMNRRTKVFLHLKIESNIHQHCNLSNNGYEKNMSHIPQCPIAIE